MAKSGSQKATNAHRKVQNSTARNRKNVKRPNEKKKVEETIPTEVIEGAKVAIKEDSKEAPEEKQETKAEEVKVETKKVEKEPEAESKAEEITVIVPKIQKFSEPKEDLEQAIKKSKPKAIKISIEMPEEPKKEAKEAPKEVPITGEMPEADMSRVNARMKARKEEPKTGARVSAREMKEQAIRQAFNSAKQRTIERPRAIIRVRLDWKRVVLAMTCALMVVFAVVYFVNLNSPDLSLKVAAMQTGIEASYPDYVPRDYALSDITSESGKITLNFRNASTEGAFSVIEEKSSWDSNALFSNYVRPEFGDDYTLIKEQGLSIYIHGSDAAWVNKGVMFKIKTLSGSLTKKQLTNIAVSL